MHTGGRVSLPDPPVRKGGPAPGAVAESLAETFGSALRAQRWINRMVMGPGRDWVFLLNGKAATSTMLALFHGIEYGVLPSARVRTPAALNPDQAVHALTDAGLFVRCADLAANAPSEFQHVLSQALRVTTVRHPLTRAVSGYLYLCRSDAEASPQFLSERLRLSAATGFDWSEHPGTADGMLRFLDWMEEEAAEGRAADLETHFRPQVLNIRPKLFRPDLVGRVETLATFPRELAERLGRPLPKSSLQSRNQGAPAKRATAGRLLRDGRIAARVADIFAEDFAAFSYLPDQLPEIPE